MELCILCVTLLMSVALAKDCTEVEYKTMQNKYIECITNYQYQIRETRKTASERDIQKLTCEYFTLAVNNCGKVLEMCQSKDNIRRTKENTITDLIPAGGPYSHKCKVVVQYRKSRRQKREMDIHGSRQEDCTESNLLKAKQDMKKCSDTAAVVVNSSIKNITDPIIISNIQCNALIFVGAECFNDLRNCLSSEDVRKMKMNLLNDMNSYFLELAADKFSNQSLEICQLIQTDYAKRNAEDDENEAVKGSTSLNDYEYDKDYIRSSNTDDHPYKNDIKKHENTDLGINSHVLCSKANKELADEHMNNCTHLTASNTNSKLEKTTDPMIASNIVCSAQTIIHTECVKLHRNCFSPQYVNWLVEPMEQYVFDLARAKFAPQSLQKCYEMGYDYEYNSQQNNNLSNAIKHIDTDDHDNNSQDGHNPRNTQEPHDMGGKDMNNHNVPVNTDNIYAQEYQDIDDNNVNIQNNIGNIDAQKYLDLGSNDYNSENVQKHQDSTGQYVDSSRHELCSETTLYQEMETCSHFIAINVHTDIQNINDSSSLYNIACEALTILGTECVKGLKYCFSAQDVIEIRVTQIKQWKNFLIELIRVKSGIKLSLENCHTQKIKYFKSNIKISDNSYINHHITNNQYDIAHSSIYDTESVNKEIYEENNEEHYQNTQDHEDIQRKGYNGKYSTNQKESQNSPGNTDIRNKHFDNELCSESNLQIANDHIENCTQLIATNVYSNLQNTTDPIIIFNLLCSAQTIIDTDCVKLHKKCYSTEYISWLVEPMKVYLLEQAKSKSGEQYLQKCHEIEPNYNYNAEESSNHRNTQDNQNIGGFDYNNQDSTGQQNSIKHQDMSFLHYNNQDNTIVRSYKEHQNMGTKDYSTIQSYGHRNYKQYQDTDWNAREYQDMGGKINNAQAGIGHDTVEIGKEMCSEALVYQKMDNCSHVMAISIHTDIMNTVDSSILYNIACKALLTIGTDCLKDIEYCFPTLDFRKIRVTQLEQWKNYLTEVIKGKSGIKPALENCYNIDEEHVGIHYEGKENSFINLHEKHYAGKQNQDNQTPSQIERQHYNIEKFNEEIGRDYSYGDYQITHDYKDMWENAFNEQDRSSQYNTHDSISLRNTPLHEELCSESNMQIADDHMDNCTHFIATNVYSKLNNTTDPIIISNIVCSAQTIIDTDCIRLHKTCFSPEYVSWLVEPMKEYLLEIVATNIGTQSLEKCSDHQNVFISKYNIHDMSDHIIYTTDRSTWEHQDVGGHMYTPPWNALDNQAIGSNGYNTQNMTDGYQTMDPYDNNALHSYSHINDKEYHDADDYEYNAEDRGYENSQEHQNMGNHRYTTDENSWEHQDRNSNEFSTQNNTAHNMGDFGHNICAETSLYEQMYKCSHFIAINVFKVTQNITDSSILYNITCQALNSISNECVNILKNCFSKKDVNKMRSIQIEQWTEYFIMITAEKMNGKVSLENCQWMLNQYIDTNFEENENTIISYHEKHYINTVDQYDSNQDSVYHTGYNNSYDVTDIEYNSEEYFGKYNKSSLDGHLEICSELKLKDTIKDMTNCSYFTANNAHYYIQNIADPAIIYNILCNALAIITTDCVKVLYNCYTTDDVSKIKINQLEQIKDYLLKHVKGKVENQSLERCQMTNVHDDLNKYVKEYQNRFDPEYYIQGITEYGNQDIGSDDKNSQEHQYMGGYGYTTEMNTWGYQEMGSNDYKAQGSTEQDGQEMCSEAFLYQQMDNCSHFIAMNVHNDIQKITDSAILYSIACKALTIIGTDCVKDLKNCFSKIDFSEIRITQLLQWKNFLIELIKGKSGYKPSIDNCQILKIEYDHIKDTNDKTKTLIEEGVEDNSYEANKNAQYHEDVWENDYNGQDSRKLEKSDDPQYMENFAYNPQGSIGLRKESQDHQDEDNYMYNGQSSTGVGNGHLNNEPCSEFNLKIADNHMDNCTHYIGTNVNSKLQNTTDPTTISNILCSAQTTIDTECVKPLKKCFSAEYVSWLVEPMKEYLLTLAEAKVSKQSLKKCNGLDMNDFYNSQDIYSDKSNAQDITGYRYNQDIDGNTYNVQDKSDPRSQDKDDYVYNAQENIGDIHQDMYDNEYQAQESIDHRYQDMDDNEYNVQDKSGAMHLDMDDNDYNAQYNTGHGYQDIYANKYDEQDNSGNSYQAINESNYDEQDNTGHRYRDIDGDMYDEQDMVENKYDEEDDTGHRYKDIDGNQYNEQDSTIHRYQDTDENKYDGQDNTGHRYQDIGGNDKSGLMHQDMDDNDYKAQYITSANNHNGYNVKESTDQRNFEEPQDLNDHVYNGKNNKIQGYQSEVSKNETCSKSNMQLADDYMDNCTRIAATNAVSELKYTVEPSKAFNLLCSALIIIDTDCVKLHRKCFSPQYVTWIVDPMKMYLVNIGRGKVGKKSLQDCQYKN